MIRLVIELIYKVASSCDLQQMWVIDVFHESRESGIDVEMNCGSCPSQTSLMWESMSWDIASNLEWWKKPG